MKRISIDPITRLEGHGNRYAQAGQRFRGPGQSGGIPERDVKEKQRPKWLRQVATRLLNRYDGSEGDDPTDSGVDNGERQNNQSILLVGILGAVLVAVGIAWLVAVATGVIA